MRELLELTKQPDAGQGPVALDGPHRDSEEGSDLLYRQAAEVAHLDHLALSWVQALEAFQRFVQREDVLKLLRRDRQVVVQFDPLQAAISLLGFAGAGIIHQDVPHYIGGHPDEVLTAIPLRIFFAEPKVGLIDESGGLQGVIGAFPSHIRRGQPVELGIDQRQELVCRTGITLDHLIQELRYVTLFSVHAVCLLQVFGVILPSPGIFQVKYKEEDGLLGRSSLPRPKRITMANQEQSAEEIFGAALELSPEQRSSYVTEACGGSTVLREHVDRLLIDYERMGSFMDDPLLAKAGGLPQHDVQILPAGHKLGRYTVEQAIGSGGMGEVYRARDEKLERVVAIKILSPGLVTGDEARRRFRKEALALAKLSQPHIAAVYDVGEQDGVDYLVMECVPGQTLSAVLKAGPLSVERATSIVLEIAGALEEAHEQGVIHRDLKPGNVMITPRGHAKVLDFGIAKLLAPLAADATASMETGLLIGTPLYMSPEQAQGNPVDVRTDLWSLGVIYFQLLTGRTPFAGDSNIAILHAIINDPPASLRALRPDAPALANQIICRCLEKDPSKRYLSSDEFIREATEVLAQISSSSRGLTAKRQFRTIAFAAVAALLITIVAAVWLFHRSSRRQWAREEAVPQIARLTTEGKSLAAFGLLEKAQSYLPGDPQIKQLAEQNTLVASIASASPGATVAIQDYATPDGPWSVLGTTPLSGVTLPKGFFSLEDIEPR